MPEYRTEGIDPIGLKNDLGQQINPATEDTLLAILSVLGGSGGYTTINDGNKSVTLAGTSEKLIASVTPCKKITITANLSNGDVIVVGGATVVAANIGRTGVALLPNQSYDLQIDDVSKVYIDAVVSGNGVSFAYYN